jgi:Fic family protein
MKSFVPGFIERQPIPQNLLRTIRLLGEYKGREEMFKRQPPQALETLRQAALILSTESSNRIEGVTAPPDRIVKLVGRKAKPRDRSEQEIAGYRDVLSTIHARHAEMKFGVGLVLQLHRDLFKFTTENSGRWKSVSNEIAQVRADGTKTVRFKPVGAHLTEEAMRALHERFARLWESGEVEPLLLMARLLSLLLLYQAGYEVGRFMSLELMVENSKDGYYDSLYQCSQGWHESKHPLLPWWEYFLGVMLLAAYREFEKGTGVLRAARGAKTALVLDAIARLPHGFRMVELERMCPNVTRDMIRVVLNKLKKEKKIYCVGFGAGAVWKKRSKGG